MLCAGGEGIAGGCQASKAVKFCDHLRICAIVFVIVIRFVAFLDAHIST